MMPENYALHLSNDYPSIFDYRQNSSEAIRTSLNK